MAKSNQIKKLVNGEIADADDINDIVESAGNEGGAIPYDPATDQRDTTGSQSLGSTAYPWGSLYLNRDAILGEIDPVSNTLASSVTVSNLRKFISQKDTPASYSGEGGKAVIVKSDETGLEFAGGVNVAGDIIQAIADTEVATTSTSPTKVKEIVVPFNGELRIKFDLKSSGGGNTAGRIYRNGVAVGTTREDIDATYTTYSEDISGWSAGDLCQLYIWEALASGFARNFRISVRDGVNFLTLLDS